MGTTLTSTSRFSLRAARGLAGLQDLRGRETYKYMWGARGRLNCRRRLHPNGVGKTPTPSEQLKAALT